MSATLGSRHRTWVVSLKRYNYYDPQIKAAQDSKPAYLHLRPLSTSCVTHIPLTTQELQDRRQSRSVSPPGRQHGGGARSMSPEASPETSPELIPKAWPIPGAKPHSSWDIFSDIIPLAIKACLIHGHCWGRLYATSCLEHPEELCAEPRALIAGREEETQGQHLRTSLKLTATGKGPTLCCTSMAGSTFSCPFSFCLACQQLHKRLIGPVSVCILLPQLLAVWP